MSGGIITERKAAHVGETLWRYFSVGSSSEALLILPGSLGAGEGMARLTAQFIPYRRVLALEYAPVATVVECLEGIDRILELEATGSVVVYGGSFGGLIAQCWVRRHPDRVTHLILSGSGSPEAARANKNLRLLRYLPFVPMGLIRVLMRLGLRNMLRPVSENREMWRSEFLQLIRGLTPTDLASRYRIAIDFDQNYNFTASDLQGLPIKILLLEGSRDKIANPKTREKMRKLYPQAFVYTFRGAGHALLLTHTQEWAGVLKEFLA